NQADRLALQYVTRFGAGLKATVADGRIASRNPSRRGEHQAECELRGRGARRAAAGIADGDALRGQRRAVDQCGARAGQPEHLELRQAGDQRGRKRRSLPRGEHDVEIGKPSSRVVLVRERRLEKLHVGTRHQRRPVGAAAGDVLPIVDYRNSIQRYSSLSCAWLAFHHGSKSRLSFVSTAGRSRRPSPSMRPMFLRWVTAGYLAFLIVPIALLLVGSFGELWLNTLLPTGFTTHWYRNVASDPSFRRAFAASLAVVAIACSACALIGLPLAYAVFHTESRRIRALTRVLYQLPVALPPLVLAFGFILVFSSDSLPWLGSIWLLAAGHVVLTLPYFLQAVVSDMQRL